MAGKWRYGYVTVVLFLAVFFAAGCKKESVSADVANSSINESEDSSAKEEKVKETSEESTESLELWYTREVMTPYLEAVLSDYEAKTGIKVNCVQKSGIDFVEEINEASVNQGNGPDLFIAQNDVLEQVKLAGLAAPNDMYGEVYTEENYPKTALEAVTYRGELIGYPMDFETAFLLYNPNLNDALPSTVEELKALTETYEGTGETSVSIMKWDAGDVFLNYFFIGSYMDLATESGDDNSDMVVDNDNIRACLTYFGELNQYFPVNFEEEKYDDIIESFKNGNIIYTVVKTGVLKELEESGIAYKTGILPALNDTLTTRSLSVTNMAVVNAHSKNMDQAKEVAKYLSYDRADSMYELTGKLPAKKNISYSNEWIQPVMEQYENSISLPQVIGMSNFWIELDIAFENIWKGNDVGQVMDTFNSNVASYYKK